MPNSRQEKIDFAAVVGCLSQTFLLHKSLRAGLKSRSNLAFVFSFLLEVAEEDDEAEGKEAEDKGVFFGFGDCSAIDGQAQGLAGEIGMGGGLIGSRIELAHVEVG